MVLRGLRSVEVTDPPRWTASTPRSQAAAADTVWAEDCHSWYKTDAGRITNNWTAHTTEYRRRLSHPDLSAWDLEPA